MENPPLENRSATCSEHYSKVSNKKTQKVPVKKAFWPPATFLGAGKKKEKNIWAARKFGVPVKKTFRPAPKAPGKN